MPIHRLDLARTGNAGRVVDFLEEQPLQTILAEIT